jgi:hypothetical protein
VAVRDSYAFLKRHLVARFRTHWQGAAEGQEFILTEFEKDARNYVKPLEKAIRVSGADQDIDILHAASALLEIADGDGRIRNQYGEGPVPGSVFGIRSQDMMLGTVTVGDVSSVHVTAPRQGKDTLPKEESS